MPVRKSNDHCEYKVGDRVAVTLSSGRIVHGTVIAIMYYKDGIRLQVGYGKDETALVYLWQVRPAD